MTVPPEFTPRHFPTGPCCAWTYRTEQETDYLRKCDRQRNPGGDPHSANQRTPGGTRGARLRRRKRLLTEMRNSSRQFNRHAHTIMEQKRIYCAPRRNMDRQLDEGRITSLLRSYGQPASRPEAERKQQPIATTAPTSGPCNRRIDRSDETDPARAALLL